MSGKRSPPPTPTHSGTNVSIKPPLKRTRAVSEEEEFAEPGSPQPGPSQPISSQLGPSQPYAGAAGFMDEAMPGPSRQVHMMPAPMDTTPSLSGYIDPSARPIRHPKRRVHESRSMSRGARAYTQDSSSGESTRMAPARTMRRSPIPGPSSRSSNLDVTMIDQSYPIYIPYTETDSSASTSVGDLRTAPSRSSESMDAGGEEPDSDDFCQ